MFLIDFEQGRLIPDEELKSDFARKMPYGDWLKEQRIRLADLHPETEPHGFDSETLLARMQAFGYTTETMSFMLRPLVEQLRDPVGSMGNDSALACLSDKPRMIYDYFKQLFAQVTNPAIDSIREEVIMSLECYIGPEQNLLDATPEHCHRLLIEHPILTNEEIEALKTIDHEGWKSRVIDITFDRSEGKAGLQQTLDRISAEAEAAADEGIQLVVLSDRAMGQDRVPDQRAACRWRGPPSPGQADQADADRFAGRNGRSTRGPSPLPADRLRGRRASILIWRSKPFGRHDATD